MTGDEETFDATVSDGEGRRKEEKRSFLFHQEANTDDIPPSLLSYFETSKSRAAVCERLILEEVEDTMNSPTEPDNDEWKLNQKVIWDAENEEIKTSSDNSLSPAPTELEGLFTPKNEDKVGAGEHMESERCLAFDVTTFEVSLNEEERKKSGRYEAEREKRHCEEAKREERKRQIERDFQEELKKIMEAEKLHQKELELMERRAQEKLERELHLQQKLISNLKRRVEEERRMREEEQRRIKDEEDKRKREEEKIKEEAERKRREDEARKKEEEERKIEEMKLRKEEEKKKEQEKWRLEREEKRKREEERKMLDLEKKKLEEETRMMKEEEERKNREEMERMKKEEESKMEEEKRKEEEKKKIEKRKVEEEMRMRKEEECQKKEEGEERIKGEEKNMRIEEKIREIDKRKKQEEMMKTKEEENDRNKNKEMGKSYKREGRDVGEEIKPEEREKMEAKDMKKKEEERKKEKELKEVVRKGEGEELRPIVEDEMEKHDDEWKAKEEEQRRRQKEEMRQHDEEDYEKSEEEIRPMEEKEACKGFDNGKMGNESKAKAKEKKQEVEEKKQGEEETRLKEEERRNVKDERDQNGEEVRGNKKVNKETEEEIRVEEKEKNITRRKVQESEKKINEKRENHSMKKSIDKPESSLVSQQEGSMAWTSPGLSPLHSESTVDPVSTETTRQFDPDKNIGQISAGCENQAAGPSLASAFVPTCLPEHTEQKRLSWMKDCVSWSKLSLQNRRKQRRSVQSRRGRRRAPEASSLPPLCPNSLLEATGWKSLQEVTTVTLEDLPGCSLSTLAPCAQLQSLTLRRCGLRSLEGISHLAQLCYIDVQENDISFIDCENMTSLRVLRLAHNKLTSIHGLSGAENLDLLDLSHNSISRIAGLESVKRLQRLSVDHNQLISTKGLQDVYTLLYLSCSHNHLASVEGLENSALLSTLDLRANSLTEPPRLKNQVLLRELHLDDNSVSSLLDLAACWLPLLQHLSVAQNSITQLPSMSDLVSLANLDLRFNCISELQNVCESLEGCQSLREVHLTENPLQQESGWRSTLQRAVPGLRAIDDQETDSFVSPPAVQQVGSASGSFLTFCQAQLQQTSDLQQRHSRELSNASSSLDAVKTSCRHFTEALLLAEDQRFAHEYGDTTVTDKHGAAGQTAAEETLDMDVTNIEKCTERPEMESTGQVPAVIPKRDNMRCNAWTFEEKSAAESRHDTFDTVMDSKMEPVINKIDSGSLHSLAEERKTISSDLKMASVSNYQKLDVKNTAAVVIQQLWRKYRQKCGNISSPSTAENGGGRGGDGGKPESGPSCINRSQDHAAAVIQAFWRGFTLRRRLASALAAVTCLDTGEDDTFEELDVDEFVFDEAALEKHWTLSLSEDSTPRRYSVSEQPLSLKPAEHFPEPSQYKVPPPLVGRSKQAWVAGEPVASAGQSLSPVSSNRSKSPASPSVVSGLSERSEKILEEWGFTHSHTALLMLKRAQNMKSKNHQQRKRRDPSVRLALFRNCSYHLGPVETHNRKAQNNRNDTKVREAEPGLQQAERTEALRRERARQRLHTQAARPDRDPESMRFLPEISSDILNGGRVQLVADPGYTERPHHASGLRANSRSAAQPRKENNYPRRNSLGHARKEAPSPKRVTSAPSKTERISFRDNPVQLSAGWGGGKKRDKVFK